MRNRRVDVAAIPSRRQFVLEIGGLSAVAAMAATSARAAERAKLDQRSAAYQPTPKGKARCDGCTQWQTPDACKVVSGKIDPAGWCVLYAHKS